MIEVAMSLKSQIDNITELAESVVSDLGMTLVDVRFGQTGRRRTLEVTIFRAGGRIALEDCESVSRALEDALDKQATPLVDGAYLLEVASPGIDRQLSSERELRIFSGQSVEVMIKGKIEALGAAFVGVLLGARDGRIEIGDPKPVSSGKSKGRTAAKSAQAQSEIPARLELETSQVIRIRLHPEAVKQDKKSLQETHQ